MTLFNSSKARIFLATTLSFSALSFSIPALSLQSDRNQPITIDANTAERDELAGTTTYAGNVEMAQGSMRINADKIVIYNTKDKVTKIIARGKPAAYQQKPNDTEGKVVARANILEYQIDKETLRLLEGASLQQEGTSLSGNTIEYDVRRSVVKAGSDAKQNQRVRMVIPPKALQSNEKDPLDRAQVRPNMPQPAPAPKPNIPSNMKPSLKPTEANTQPGLSVTNQESEQ
ncbi:lipopolysaccharide transport periplasmic protein LptA [Marinagarivorans algicola]|uniref:lipopolysaccharide transport periplasmic protein LptA n=1 Tax=Marinagarivorans algicola TaxID=1513270 RepID=UPI0009EBE2C4|nr:lipopolysaccharide transport periplasmic protein LptA [Marinagarivorans algicola]